MKDVKELVLSASLAEGDIISVSGWIVDQNDGLSLLGDHFPENYDFP
nr:hypothetical protein [Herbaspirillum sp. ASV7]